MPAFLPCVRRCSLRGFEDGFACRSSPYSVLLWPPVGCRIRREIFIERRWSLCVRLIPSHQGALRSAFSSLTFYSLLSSLFAEHSPNFSKIRLNISLFLFGESSLFGEQKIACRWAIFCMSTHSYYGLNAEILSSSGTLNSLSA